ncbi:MAG: hypothetical protein E6K96_10290 [Thaumarchaeota archaeon]|nr:MAG: hypothetical protein E6K96_10290 [Nitrososphaerota archaeon]
MSQQTRRVPREATIACDAKGMTYPPVRALEGYGYDVVTVANLKQLQWIVKSRKKAGRVDSETLANLHEADRFGTRIHESQCG